MLSKKLNFLHQEKLSSTSETLVEYFFTEPLVQYIKIHFLGTVKQCKLK